MTPLVESIALTIPAAAVAMTSLRGRHTNSATIDTWIRVGYRPRNWPGERIKLPCAMVGNRRLIMREWLEDFQRRRLAMVQPLATPTAGQATRAHRRAVERLEAMGMRVGGAK